MRKSFYYMMAACIFVSFESVSLSVHAQDICGNPPVVTDKRVQIELNSTAENSLRQVGQEDFYYALKEDREDIFAKYQKGERAVAYYQYIVCKFLQEDKILGAAQKIIELDKAFSALFIPYKNSYQEYSFFVLNEYDGIKKVVRSLLRKDGNQWLEIQLGEVEFTFREVEQNDNYILLIDDSRELEIKVPVQGGFSLIRYTGGKWRQWNEVHPPLNPASE